ncbi:T9SS type A sorting domain-containing protein [candidate division WOR-3 bacterium]|nr:T9SS type A sorting domain-containing protein [candidate division WOR-3 bacterium]
MIQIYLGILAFTGFLTPPFRIAEAEPGHHQVCLRADMAPDGRFAIAWVDSLETDPGPNDVFIRFFDKDGAPLTDAYRVEKVHDTNWIYWPSLQMDSSGNAVLVWADNRTQGTGNLPYIRYQRFDRDGNPTTPALTLREDVYLTYCRPIDISLASNGDFAVATSELVIYPNRSIQVQRFDAEGEPYCELFFPHEDFGETSISFFVPQVALNDNGDLVVTWLDFLTSSDNYVLPKFQVFDADNEPILPWEPMGHRPDEGDSVHDPTRVKPFWFDEDRFVLFWIDALLGRVAYDLVGRVFSDRGLTRYFFCDHLLPDDSAGPSGKLTGLYSIDINVIPDPPFDAGVWAGHFVFAYSRVYLAPVDLDPAWEHQVGLTGEIHPGNWLQRFGYPFQFSPEWGADTVMDRKSFREPAVAASADRIAWAYSRCNPDTILEAWAMISDWDVPDDNMIEEEPMVNPSPIKLTPTLNRLSYEVPGEAQLSIYNSAGRRVAEQVVCGKGEWQAVDIPSGVYFARVENTQGSARAKVVVIK